MRKGKERKTVKKKREREEVKEGSVRINYIKGQQDIKSMCLGRTY